MGFFMAGLGFIANAYTAYDILSLQKRWDKEARQDRIHAQTIQNLQAKEKKLQMMMLFMGGFFIFMLLAAMAG